MLSDRSISLERRGEGFVLVKTDQDQNRHELELSEADVLFLPRILQEAIGKISAAKNHSSEAYAVPAVKVCGAQLNITADRKAILLSLVDAFSNEATFALPRDIAQPLGTRFSARASELEPSD